MITRRQRSRDFISQQKAGLRFDIIKGVSLDASYYNVAPLADQTV
jgi:hypothetical protein